MPAEALPTRKRRHLEVCLHGPVGYETRTTGFERYDLPYDAVPESDLAAVDLRTVFLGKRLQAPLLVGAMTGGAAQASTINRNLALAAQRLGIGMMLGSQRVMLEHPAERTSFEVRDVAPDVLLVGNLGAAQLVGGYGVREAQRAVREVGADALAFHVNPLQEALQAGGDVDWRGVRGRLAEVVPEVGVPVLLKEVGHGLSAATARSVAGVGFAALDVAGAGGTSWARVEDLVRYGEIRHPDLVEWGIPTAEALCEVRAALPGVPLVASGGVRTGLDVAKAIALGAQVAAIARPLLAPALVSAEAVEAALATVIDELRLALHLSGCTGLTALASTRLRARVG